MAIKYTRQEYMSGKVSHDDYYAQFGQHLTGLVSRHIGVHRIINSTDPHFNDIPLTVWDRLSPLVRQYVGRMIAEANGTGGISLSDCVCAAKSAARIIKRQHNGEQK